jgi:hypothetical protein
MSGDFEGETHSTLLHPYPRRENALLPDRVGFPIRPRNPRAPTTTFEHQSLEILQRMNEVLARVQELEEALDDPKNLWRQLRIAWNRAQDETDPRMSEIVKQSREMQPKLGELGKRIRKVLRRTREMTPLDRVQEMDRASMRWLVRQPGHSIAERAGASQRIMATVRHENFDTPENRVLHAYCILAAGVAREWLNEHPRAKASSRYLQVENFRKKCRLFVDLLVELEVNIATAGIIPNYVLLQDTNYSAVFESWKRLLARQKVLDDLWAWQAETWTDFIVLAIVLALDDLDESELLVQSPIVWKPEASMGRWFDQDRPLAVFWLKDTGRIIEVQSRPKRPSQAQTLSRAHVSLKVTDPSRSEMPRRIAVWTPHSMVPINLEKSVNDANELLRQLQRVGGGEILRNGLILAPASYKPKKCFAEGQLTRVDGISFDAAGASLHFGLTAIAEFTRLNIYRDVE